MSQRRKTYKNIAVNGMFTYFNQGINFIALILLSRLLSPSDYGIFALIGVFSAFISIFQDNGILQAIIRGDKNDPGYSEKLNTLSLFTGIFCTVFMWILAIPISMFYKNDALIMPSLLIGLTFLLNSLIIVPNASLQKELKFKLFGTIQVISNIAALICCCTAAYFGMSYWSLVIRELAFFSFQLVLLLNFNKVGFNFNVREMRNSFIRIKLLIMNITGFNVINFFSRYSDNLLIGKIYGEEKLGIYNRAYSLIYLCINLISGIFNQVLLPSLEKQNNSNISREYFFSTNLIAFLLFPLMLLFNVIPNHITLFIFGNKWTEISLLLPYIGILIFAQCQINIVGNIFVLCKKEKYLVKVALINTILSVTGIVIGLFFSFFDVIKYYTLFSIGLSMPVTVYIVYHIVLSNSFSSFIRFWLPKIGIIWVAYSLIWFQKETNLIAWACLSIFFYIHIIIQERVLILNFSLRLKNKIQNPKN